MDNDSKQLIKVSYRINNYIKSIIDKTKNEVRRQTGLNSSGGKIARTFWTALAEDPVLRKKCMHCVCKKIVEEESSNKARRGKRK